MEFKILPGQYFDQETGLHYNYFRDYDPTTGRYIESDPVGLEGKLNTYSYAYGNSINYIDPLGLMGSQGEPAKPPIDPYGAKHTQRNRNNKCPKCEPTNGMDCEGNLWSPDDINTYHGGHHTYRSPDPQNPGAGFQCAYDKSSGDLITSGPLGPFRGTYDYTTPSFGSYIKHYYDDILPHKINPHYEDPDHTEIYCVMYCCK